VDYCVHCRDWREERRGGGHLGRMAVWNVPCALSAGCRKVRPVGIGMQIATKRSHIFLSLLLLLLQPTAHYCE
jgi:hypothetical protein